MKKNIKYYFKDRDSEISYTLDYFIDQAKKEGLNKITLIEAIPIKDNVFCWCSCESDVVSRSDCRKSECNLYESNKSGRGTCIHRRGLCDFGDEVTFNIK